MAHGTRVLDLPPNRISVSPTTLLIYLAPDKKDPTLLSMEPCHVCGRASFDNYRVPACLFRM